MTDPLLTSVLIAVFIAAAAAMRWFKSLDGGFLQVARTPILAGIVSGGLLSLARHFHPTVVAGVVLAAAALYVRLLGRESEPSEGMLLGGVTGAVASLGTLFFPGDHALELARNLLAGSVAGFGITFAALHVLSRGRRLLLDLVTACMAVAAATLAGLKVNGLSSREVAIAVTVAIPFLVFLTVLKQWPEVRSELRHESALGFIEEADILRTANPFLRLGAGGWRDRHAHREFVRLANKIALRKRQQRHRPEEIARLYQLEIIKLRMQLQEMSAINRLVGREADGESAETFIQQS